ncbi:DUF5123 domain-containing protein [Prolixibacter sp. NT017]|uniref:DUF5123 domain-containing protein n=1 Tax=Prolixibacter sp. NT017 TaxID=2652390 RepID=UPI001890AF55|nr:DUF4957 domain-containing protein [Prolixibacter sp. NT017]
MKNKYITLALIFGLLSTIFMSCQDNIPAVIDQLTFERVFTPLNLQVKVRDKTTAEISWDERGDASSYILQVSQDSLDFSDIVETDTITSSDNPYSVDLIGNLRYSVRMVGISDSLSNSKWSDGVTFKTLPENIFYAVADTDIHATSATLRWPAKSKVTDLVVNPGDTKVSLTAQEIANGAATISGLTGRTTYTVKLYKDTIVRGTASFTTYVDVANATPVHPGDDLATVIANAGSGDVLALYPGDYSASAGNITIDKSITIVGVYPFNKPLLHNQFVIADGAQDVVLEALDMNGAYTDATDMPVTLDEPVQYNTTDFATLGTLTLRNVTVDTYNKSFISDGGSQFETSSILVDNCVVSNVYNSGGDFIDSRKSFIQNLTVTNSTFNNCATVNTRDFIRMDGGTKGNSYDDGTNTPVIVVSHCTLYDVMNSSSSTKRMFYVRWSMNEITSSHNILSDMGNSVYSNQSATTQPVCDYNNYFNADGYISGDNLSDNSNTYTTEDPGFKNPATGDFTISNPALIDNQVGDPRWY